MADDFCWYCEFFFSSSCMCILPFLRQQTKNKLYRLVIQFKCIGQTTIYVARLCLSIFNYWNFMIGNFQVSIKMATNQPIYDWIFKNSTLSSEGDTNRHWKKSDGGKSQKRKRKTKKKKSRLCSVTVTPTGKHSLNINH